MAKTRSRASGWRRRREQSTPRRARAGLPLHARALLPSARGDEQGVGRDARRDGHRRAEETGARLLDAHRRARGGRPGGARRVRPPLRVLLLAHGALPDRARGRGSRRRDQHRPHATRAARRAGAARAPARRCSTSSAASRDTLLEHRRARGRDGHAAVDALPARAALHASATTSWASSTRSSATSERLLARLRTTDRCTLGCGALAGTSYPVDRELVARLLGFARSARTPSTRVRRRLRARGRGGRGQPDGDAQPPLPGPLHLAHGGVRLRGDRRRVRGLQLDDAAEEERLPVRVRPGARGRPRDRRLDGGLRVAAQHELPGHQGRRGGDGPAGPPHLDEASRSLRLLEGTIATMEIAPRAHARAGRRRLRGRHRARGDDPPPHGPLGPHRAPRRRQPRPAGVQARAHRPRRRPRAGGRVRARDPRPRARPSTTRRSAPRWTRAASSRPTTSPGGPAPARVREAIGSGARAPGGARPHPRARGAASAGPPPGARSTSRAHRGGRPLSDNGSARPAPSSTSS